MADTQIDELRLDITVEDKTSGESSDKKVKNLATAISRLNKNLQAFDNAKFTKVFDNMSKGLDPFVKKIENVSNALASLATIVSKGGLDKAVKEVTGKVPEPKTETTFDSGRKSGPTQAVQEQAKELGNISEQTKKLAKVSNDWAGKLAIAKRQLELIEGKLASGTLKESQIVAYQSKRISLLDKIDKINQQITKEKENQEKADEDGGKKEEKKATSLSKLLKSFGRIAMYRAIRRTIQEITQAFMESIDGIARYNSEFRDTMGGLQTSINKLKVSAGVGFYQVLILIEPLIEQISNGIVSLANSLSKVSAQMRGVAQYTKINTNYMKKYKSALDGTLLSFDTFTTLGKGSSIDFSQMLETVDTPLDKEKWSDLDVTISGLVLAFQGIWKVLKVIIEGVGKLVKWLSDKNLLTPAVYTFLGILLAIKSPFALLITGIATLIGGWEKMSTTARHLIPIIAVLASLLTGLAVAKAAAAAGIAAPAMAGITAAAIAAGVALTAGSIIALKAYKDGGIMNTGSFKGAGTMYALAGENGAEIVAQGSQGTGVANVEQIAEAEYRGTLRALYEYGAAQNGGMAINLDMNKLGTAVASNVGFRNEANRRNAGLNWK